MSKKRGFPKIFFGWWIVLAGGFLTMWGWGYHDYGFSAAFKPLASELGISRAVTSVAAGIGKIGGGLGAPVVGWLTDRFGPRWVMLFGISLFSLGLILMNFINSLWAFYVVWGVIVASGLNIGFAIPLLKVITNWFVKKRGLAIGIRWLFSGLLILPLISWLITNQGWRMAYLIGGLIVCFVGLPLTWFFIRQERPEYYGLLPDGATVEAGLEEDTSRMIERGIEYAAEVEEVEFSLRQAMRTPPYWMLILAQIGSGAAIGSLLVHLVPFLTDIGMSLAKATTLIAIAGLSSLPSRFMAGLLADRAKKDSVRFLYGGALLLQAIGIATFLLNQTIAMVYPFVILFHIGWGAGITLLPIVGGRYFGRKAFGSISGSMIMFIMPVGILAPIFAGWVYDTIGSYIIVFTILAALLAFGTVVMFLTRPPKPPAEVTDIRKIV